MTVTEKPTIHCNLCSNYGHNIVESNTKEFLEKNNITISEKYINRKYQQMFGCGPYYVELIHVKDLGDMHICIPCFVNASKLRQIKS